MAAAGTAAGTASSKGVKGLRKADDDTGEAYIDYVDAVSAIGRVSAVTARETAPTLAVIIPALLVTPSLLLGLRVDRVSRAHLRLGGV